MPDDVNRIKNADLSAGRSQPRSWTLQASDSQAGWRWRDAPGAEPGRLFELTSAAEDAGVQLRQEVRCKPKTHYRVEARLEADLVAADPAGGVRLVLTPGAAEGAQADPPMHTPPVRQTAGPLEVCARWVAPPAVRRAEIGIALAGASGSVTVHDVRFIELIEPEETSHALAAAPPSPALQRPPQAERVCVCSAHAEDRPVTALLTAALGVDRVHTRSPKALRLKELADGEALLLPDAEPPAAVRSVDALRKLAKERVVIVSLPAFVQLAGPALRLRRVEQNDDLPCAKVVYGSYATAGFVLQDMFPFAGDDDEPGLYVQNHIRQTPAQRAYCKAHGFTVLLESACDQDVTSDRPLCLHHATERGGLFVLDVEPAEASARTDGAPNLAAHLLLNALGRVQAPFGQYVYPAQREAQLREEIREMAVRYPGLFVEDADAAPEDVHDQLVWVGRDEEAFGLPLQPKPVVLLRTGRRIGDVGTVYGVWFWLKQLTRGEPHRCSYLRQLCGQLRLVWEATCAPWQPKRGWSCAQGCELDFERDLPPALHDAPLAALVDVVAEPGTVVRVGVPDANDYYDHCARWLPRLASACGLTEARDNAPAAIGWGPPPGGDPADYAAYAWRALVPELRVEVDADLLADEAARRVHAAGGQVVRLVVPAHEADSLCSSIVATNLVSTLVEQVVGLVYGLLAVNRGRSAMQLDGLAPVAPGDALILPATDPILRDRVSRAG